MKIEQEIADFSRSRKEMPQIEQKDISNFITFLKDKKIDVTKTNLDPSLLKATQGNFSKEKVDSIISSMNDETYEPLPIIVSNDFCVLDGHHRWLAHIEKDSPIPVHQVNLDAETPLDTMDEYPKSFTKKLYESFMILEAAEAPSVTAAQLKVFEKVIDSMFKHYKIDFVFTNHFGERMSDARNNPKISIQELAATVKKLYSKLKTDGKTFSKYLDAQAVIKDLQSDINIPVKVEYDKKNDELDVVMKTIMRKKDFYTPDEEIKLS